MKKFLIAGSSLAAVAAAGSAGAVDVTLGGSIELGFEFGIGKGVDNLMTVDGTSVYQAVTLSLAAAGTTDAGMKFGGSFGLSTADELEFGYYKDKKGVKYETKYVNSEAAKDLHGVVYNVSGGAKITEDKIVSVKINSDWYGAESKYTEYGDAWVDLAQTTDLCKIAGKAGNNTAKIARVNNTGSGQTKVAQLMTVGVDEYLPAGRLTAGAVNLTAMNSNYTKPMVAVVRQTGAAVGDLADHTASVGFSGTINDLAANATVYAGPFMEVMLTSSTTKMVVGGVCVTNKFENSSTAIYRNLATPVMQVGQASIYIEGGFGKLTLQQGKYTGKVAAIGDAGNAAQLDAGLVAILEGASFMGMTGYAAVDVTSIKTGQRPNYMVGTNIDLLGLSLAVDMEDAANNSTWIDSFDIGTSYAIGDLAVDAVIDSDGDWGLKASAAVAGFSATSVIENVGIKKHEKSGLSIDTTLATSFNGIGVSIGLDENLDYTLSGSYSLGNSGLAITVGYDSGEEGGAVAAKLTF